MADEVELLVKVRQAIADREAENGEVRNADMNVIVMWIIC